MKLDEFDINLLMLLWNNKKYSITPHLIVKILYPNRNNKNDLYFMLKEEMKIRKRLESLVKKGLVIKSKHNNKTFYTINSEKVKVGKGTLNLNFGKEKIKIVLKEAIYIENKDSFILSSSRV